MFDIDLEEPPVALSYPVAYTPPDVHIYSVGEPIPLHNGTLTLDDATRSDGSVLLSWTFVNASSGYEATLEFSITILADNGTADESCAGSWVGGGECGGTTVGPGQTKTFQCLIGYSIPSDVGGFYLLLLVTEHGGRYDTGYVIDLTSVP